MATICDMCKKEKYTERCNFNPEEGKGKLFDICRKCQSVIVKLIENGSQRL